MEQWKDVKGFEEYYSVSNTGKVFSKRSNKIMKIHMASNGYCLVCLSVDAKLNYKIIHRLVAEVFVENPNNYNEVNHKDENKLNNTSDNLEWCTRQYNNTYGDLTKNKMKKVRQISMDGETLEIYESIRDASEKTKCAYTHIGSVCRGERKRCGGYVWKYA